LENASNIRASYQSYPLPEKVIVFVKEDALNFEGDSGPYLQYSYARASSILKKSKKKPGKFEIQQLKEQEIKLAKKLADLPRILSSVEIQLSPALIANYSFQLAQIFNEFYHSCPVIGSKEEGQRLALVQSFKTVLGTCLNLLGIASIEEM
jgi:arginyl-tRNA synthetase